VGRVACVWRDEVAPKTDCGRDCRADFQQLSGRTGLLSPPGCRRASARSPRPSARTAAPTSPPAARSSSSATSANAWRLCRGTPAKTVSALVECGGGGCCMAYMRAWQGHGARAGESLARSKSKSARSLTGNTQASTRCATTAPPGRRTTTQVRGPCRRVPGLRSPPGSYGSAGARDSWALGVWGLDVGFGV
jgi:hypothetical protein